MITFLQGWNDVGRRYVGGRRRYVSYSMGYVSHSVGRCDRSVFQSMGRYCGCRVASVYDWRTCCLENRFGSSRGRTGKGSRCMCGPCNGKSRVRTRFYGRCGGLVCERNRLSWLRAARLTDADAFRLEALARTLPTWPATTRPLFAMATPSSRLCFSDVPA